MKQKDYKNLLISIPRPQLVKVVLSSWFFWNHCWMQSLTARISNALFYSSSNLPKSNSKTFYSFKQQNFLSEKRSIFWIFHASLNAFFMHICPKMSRVRDIRPFWTFWPFLLEKGPFSIGIASSHSLFDRCFLFLSFGGLETMAHVKS